ncbi:MAG TPA: DUF6569 family protein [Nevskiaceae bacterium]|nr:DUF6569 family protein [Nevskiaceae bacterium]
MPLIRETLAHVEIGVPVCHDNLALFPLLSTAPAEARYLTLDDALAHGQCAVSEVSEGGVVAELRFENRSAQPILLLDGEELVGAKQNRVLNLTILCGGTLQINIPVSCVEQGRWRYRTKQFHAAGRTLYSRARAAKMQSVNESMMLSSSRRSDQGQVWDHIAAKQRRMAAHSDTGAAESIYEKARPTTEAFVRAMPPLPGQVGGVFVVNGAISGIELFDAASTYAKVAAKLVESFALDAIDVDARDPRPVTRQEVAAFLERVCAVPPQSVKAVGLGHDLRLASESLVGGGLEVDAKLVHFSAFNVAPASGLSPSH